MPSPDALPLHGQAKWGAVNHKSFRDNCWELGVKASAEKIDAVFDEIDDDGSGSLEMEELKVGMKLLVESAKQVGTSNAGLEKRAASLRATAANQITALAKRERARAEELRARAIAAEKAEMARAEVEAAAAAEAARIKADAEERRRMEQNAIMARIAEQKRASFGGSRDGRNSGRSPSPDGSVARISIAEANAKARRDAEQEYGALKKRWAVKPKRKWPRHDSWRHEKSPIRLQP